MNIVAALFIDGIELNQAPGPSTRIDLTGIQFSAAAPEPFPLSWAPHFVVMLHAPEAHPGTGVLEVVFERDGEQVARNVQPLEVEPGKFSYRLVRAELEFVEPGTVMALARVDMGPVTEVPYTMLPQVDEGSPA
jgi:hypothetical protein